MRTTIMILLMALNVCAGLSPLEWFLIVNLAAVLYGFYAITELILK